MCGIAGFFAPNNDQSRSELHVTGKKMTQAIAHRGPDAADLWQDPDYKLLLGHRRLSILDLSPAGAQPMSSHTGRYIIVFNGEFYNFREIARELEGLGLAFKGRSDTEVFLCAVETWGLNRALQRISGMFAFALWDRQQKELHFARDRYGKKPLYIGWAGNGNKTSLVFGSELKALAAHPQFNRSINREALAQYLRTGWIGAPLSIYENAWMLKPAHRMTLKLDDFSAGADLRALMQPYWHPLEVAQHARLQYIETEADALETFETTFNKSVSERMISDVPLGAFLSGGIDSSAVVACMQSRSSQKIKTYTIGFEDEGFNEAEHAKEIALHLGTDHHELYLKPDDALEVIPKLPDMYDEPFADISAIPTFLVSRFARQSVTVALSGDGGDEMFGGYNRHISVPSLAKKISIIPSFLRPVFASALCSISVERWNKLRPHTPQFGTKIHKAAEIMRYSGREEIYSRLLSILDEPPLQYESTAAALPSLFEGLGFAETMMLWDALTYLPGDILTKVDRASMATSLEARAPFLDPRMFELGWSLPLNMKIRGDKGKWIIREYLARHVPRDLFERPKQGFNMPVGAWLRGSLKDWAASLLDPADLKQDAYLDEVAITQQWQAHLEGRGNHAESLWAVLMLRAWQRRWL